MNDIKVKTDDAGVFKVPLEDWPQLQYVKADTLEEAINTLEEKGLKVAEYYKELLDKGVTTLKEVETIFNVYTIPVTTQTWGTVKVVARSIKDACLYVEEKGLEPDNHNLIEGSQEIDYDGLVLYNDLQEEEVLQDSDEKLSYTTPEDNQYKLMPVTTACAINTLSHPSSPEIEVQEIRQDKTGYSSFSYESGGGEE